MKPAITRQAIRIVSSVAEPTDELVAVEARLRLSINGRELVKVYCSPTMIRELAVGFILTEGIASGVCTERMSIVYGEGEVIVDVIAEGEVHTEGMEITSGCIGGVTFARPVGVGAHADKSAFRSQDVMELYRSFQGRSELYNQTGCMHSAALADGDAIAYFAEDIGRHNAVDKVIGAAILDGATFQGRMMLASGRLSSEIARKCARWGIPVLASRTAPTALALDVAQEGGVTVIGFVRGQRMNVYTHPQRITA